MVTRNTTMPQRVKILYRITNGSRDNRVEKLQVILCMRVRDISDYYYFFSEINSGSRKGEKFLLLKFI